MRVLVVSLLLVSVAVLNCHAAAVDQTNDELVDLLNKLQSQLRSRALEEPRDAKKDENEEVDITRDEEVDAKEEEVDAKEEEIDVNIERAVESHPESRDEPPPSGGGSAPATDPRPDIAANVLKLVIDLLDDSLKLMTSLNPGSGGSGTSGGTRAEEDARRPDGSEISDGSDNSEGNDSSALDDRPVGNKRTVKTEIRHRRAANEGENEAAGGQGGAGNAAGGAEGNSTTPPGSPVVAKMLKTIVELQYNLIGFDLITMYPTGNKMAKPLADETKRSSSSSDQLAEIMDQLDKLDNQRHN
jgi:hypothetical protein